MSVGLEYYEQNYGNYSLQNPVRKLEFYKDLVKLGISTGHPKPKILDLGCAFGDFLASIAEGYELFGQDLNKAALEIASDKLPTANFRNQALPEISFTESFDAIVAFDVLEHVENLESAVCAIRNHLKPGGCFVFVVPVYDGITGPLVHLLDKDPTHIHKRSRWFWLKLVSTLGLEVLAWGGVFRYLLLRHYIHIPTYNFRRCTPAIAVITRLPIDNQESQNRDGGHPVF